MRKDAQAVLLLLVGGTLLKIGFTGTYVRYVRPGQLPLLLIAGFVLVGLAAVTLWQVIRGPQEPAAAAPADPAADLPSGFEDLAEPVGERTGSAAADPDFEPVSLAALRDPGPEREPVSFTEPVSLSALRDPGRDLEPVSLSALRDPAANRASDDGGFDRDDEVVVETAITYREFTPGELVAVPVGHRLVDRAAAYRARAARTAETQVIRLADVEKILAEKDAHTHVHREPRIAWLLLLPALALLLFAPPALGAYQASRNGTALSAEANSDFPPLPDDDPVRLSLLDYAGRAVFDQGHSLADRQVTLSGFVIAGPDGQPYLARMIVTCCAADARPVKVGLAGDLPTSLRPDQWIEVQGTYTDRSDKDPVNAELVPYLQVTNLRQIAAPEEQYES
jgi:uncharacterized repeat protein (TIGR03943 family)